MVPETAIIIRSISLKYSATSQSYQVPTLVLVTTHVNFEATEHFFHVYIASSKHEEGGRIRDSYANPRHSRGFA